MLVGVIILGSLIIHRRWHMTAVAAVAAFVVIDPWTARNYVALRNTARMPSATILAGLKVPSQCENSAIRGVMRSAPYRSSPAPADR